MTPANEDRPLEIERKFLIRMPDPQRLAAESTRKIRIRQIYLKLSGDALKSRDDLFDFDKVARVARILKKMREMGVEVGVVIGAGNIWRGRSAGDMDRTRADNIAPP